jgi:hypothetical protein
MEVPPAKRRRDDHVVNDFPADDPLFLDQNITDDDFWSNGALFAIDAALPIELALASQEEARVGPNRKRGKFNRCGEGFVQT